MHADAAEARRARGVRIVAGVAGALLTALALAPELFHAGAPGLGAIQIGLLALGIAGLLLAWLGTRFPDAYRAAAVVILNTILFLAALELAGGIVTSMWRQERPSLYRQRYYRDKPWTAGFVREQAASIDKDYYRPFALWRRGQTSGSWVNVNAEGIRRTPGAECVPGAYRVIALGGSTMWGVGSPDSATIPARLQRALAARSARPVCVTNLGEKGYTSIQELVLLITRLRSNEVPDLVLFYDGVNDVRTAADHGAAGLHFGVRSIADRLEGVPPRFDQRARASRFLSLVLRSTEPPPDSLAVSTYRQRGMSADSLAEQVVARYLENQRMVRGLSREYGFDYAFFWQPVIWRTKKPLTDEERITFRNAVRGLPELFDAVYARVPGIASREAHVYDISDVFDGQAAFLYVDWNHVVPEGNALVADRMMAVLDERAGGRWSPPPRDLPGAPASVGARPGSATSHARPDR